MSTTIGGLPDLLLRFWKHLSQRRRHQFVLVTSLMAVSALADVISLGAILPFLGILSAPESVFRHPIIANAVRNWGMSSADQLVLPIAIGFGAAAIAAAGIRILLSWVSTRLAFAIGADLSNDVYRRTLYQPYQVHIARNSSESISGARKVDGVVFSVVLPMLTFVSSTFLLVAVVVVAVLIDPMVASVAAIMFGGSYAAIAWLERHRLQSNSRRIAHEETQVVKALQEGLGGIRDVLLDGTQPIYCDIYKRADYPLRRALGSNIFITSCPRPAMEAVGMVLIAALAYSLSRQTGGIGAALPVLGALALSAQRLLPALQTSYSTWATIAGSQASLADTIELLDQPLPLELLLPAPAPLPFRDAICFDAVHFRYAREGPWVLDGLDLEIRRGDRVGFVGSTGSGKSTTLDLLMGLLAPTSGEILVDGESISGRHLRAWQRSIAHVPQTIYLADTTIAENIAFGVPRNAIDMKRVRQAARRAQIADFIEGRPEGYGAIVGERGVRLSGGQRQRIGIARALHKEASVLVFDEATSALDNATELSVMDAIDGLDRDLTVLLIAHRLTTVRRCDTIVVLEKGRVGARGTYQQLLECSPSFRQMANAAA
jgi:ATP-binding cassette subfamily B protein